MSATPLTSTTSAGDPSMKRFSRQRSVLAMALSGLMFTSLACDTMESDASKADRRVQKSVQDSAEKRRTATTQSLAAAKKASDLQGEIDKIKQQVAALTQQKDAAMSEAETAADKASKASDKDAAAMLDAATESRRKGSNIGHDIDKQSAALLPLER